MYFREQECANLGNEIPEVLFVLPVASALARAGLLQLHCPTPGFPGEK